MRLFRRTNSIRKTLEDHGDSPAELDDQEQVGDSVDPEVFIAQHEELDQIELQLARVRARQKTVREDVLDPITAQLDESELLHQTSVVGVGPVHDPEPHVDLQPLIDLSSDSDDEFNRRFDEFAAHGGDDQARRWMDSL